MEGGRRRSHAWFLTPPHLAMPLHRTLGSAHGPRTANGDGGDRVMRVDSEGVFRSWGAGLEAVFGYKEAEVIGRRVDVLVPKPLRARHWQGFNKAVARGRMRRPDKTFRSVGVHKDGRLV